MMSRQTSRPIKSASVSGPMGCAMPNLNTSSTASGVATPSITAYMASFTSGMSTRLETNPGASFTSTGVLSSFPDKSRTVAKVSRDVASPRITSTNLITGTGLKKCMPMTLSGRLVNAPSLVMEMDEVFEARITSGRASRSRSRKISVLISNFSVAASTIKSQSASLARSVTGSIFCNADALSSLVILFFATSRSRFFVMAASPRSRNCCSTSHKITAYPLRANTCAMPLPMVPAPTTATRLMSMNPPVAKPSHPKTRKRLSLTPEPCLRPIAARSYLRRVQFSVVPERHL